MKELIYPRIENTALIIIDIQDRLLASIPREDVDRMLSHVRVLLELAADFEWPTYYTQQYPDGLGSTEASILEKLQAVSATQCDKVEFSCLDNETFASSILPRLPPSVIVAGMETHVCVLETVVALQARGYQVFVPGDAVASRYQGHKENGLKLMEKAGVVETNTESIMFYALGKASGDRFKKYSKMIR